MSDKSNKYGYVGVDIPAQSFGNNKGVFNPAEINELVANNQWTSFGQLELIQTQTASAVGSVEFTDIKQDTYNVHFMTFSMTESTSPFVTRLSNNGGTSYITSGYQVAGQYGSVSGTFGEDKTTSGGVIIEGGAGGAGLGKNQYAYLYNLGDSTKYSFCTSHHMSEHPTLGHYMAFYSSVYPTAQVHNAIFVGATSITGTISLYGIRYS